MRKEYDFSKGRRNPYVKASKGKTRITIRVDDDILAWFRDRVNELDLRFSKVLRFRNVRTKISLDMYNALNNSSLVAVNSTYGPAWQHPASDNAVGGVDPILPGRLVQFGGRITF